MARVVGDLGGIDHRAVGQLGKGAVAGLAHRRRRGVRGRESGRSGHEHPGVTEIDRGREVDDTAGLADHLHGSRRPGTGQLGREVDTSLSGVGRIRRVRDHVPDGPTAAGAAVERKRRHRRGGVLARADAEQEVAGAGPVGNRSTAGLGVHLAGRTGRRRHRSSPGPADVDDRSDCGAEDDQRAEDEGHTGAGASWTAPGWRRR